jgi:hypothetical protein
MVAEAKALIRERLTWYDNDVEVGEIISLMLQARGMGDYSANHADPNTGEIVWTVAEAIRELRATSEVRDARPDTGPGAVTAMWNELGFPTTSVNGYRFPQALAATPRRVQLAEYMETGDIRWQSVARLLDEVRQAHLNGLAVVSTVGARVVVEESVRAALLDLGMSAEALAELQPWKREQTLFEDYLTNSAAFVPMDKSATRANLSAIRDRGNEAAHTGMSNDALLNEALVALLPRALISLSVAVGASL